MPLITGLHNVARIAMALFNRGKPKYRFTVQGSRRWAETDLVFRRLCKFFRPKERFYGCFNFTQDPGRCWYRRLLDGRYLAHGRPGGQHGGVDGLQPLRRGCLRKPMRGCLRESLRGGGLQPLCGRQSVQPLRGGKRLQPVQSLRGRESLRGELDGSLAWLPGDAAFVHLPRRERRSSDFDGVRRRLS